MLEGIAEAVGLPADDRSPGPVLEVPVHDSCARVVRNGFLRWLLVSALALGVMLAAIPLSRPAPLEFSLQRGRVSLAFRDCQYAGLVAHLNGAQIKER